MTGALHSRLFQASTAAAVAVAVIVLAPGYLGMRGQPLKRNFPVEKLSIALPVLPHLYLNALLAVQPERVTVLH